MLKNKMRVFIVISIMFLCVNILGAIVFIPSVNAATATYLGEMTASLYRNEPVIGEWLTANQGLEAVPGYMFNTSFPYKVKPYDKEVLFADHLSVVRILGGWNYTKPGGELNRSKAADLAYRDIDGTIKYRWDLLAPRFDPYIQKGYTDLTVVLDNTPWDLPATPVMGGVNGQSAPPQSYDEWYNFIHDFCSQLVSLYGYDTVKNWRFRMGTEADGTDRFTGTQTDFHKLYDYAAVAVKSVIPEADFGPFNAAGGSNVSVVTLATHTSSEVNYATGTVGGPFDWLAKSLYSTPKLSNGQITGADPDQKTTELKNFYDSVSNVSTQYNNLSREVHEFGILGSEFGLSTDEPGARGAAWAFYQMFDLISKAGADKIWHWGVTDFLPILNNSFDKDTTGGNPSGWTVSAPTGTSVSVVEVPDAN